jgi:hypothetical protein
MPQLEQVKTARELYHAGGTPSINDLKAIMRMKLNNNNPVTTKDFEIAEKMLGPDVGSLHGITASPPKLVHLVMKFLQ